jgi:hypothetical protein
LRKSARKTDDNITTESVNYSHSGLAPDEIFYGPDLHPPATAVKRIK